MICLNVNLSPAQIQQNPIANSPSHTNSDGNIMNCNVMWCSFIPLRFRRPICAQWLQWSFWVSLSKKRIQFCCPRATDRYFQRCQDHQLPSFWCHVHCALLLVQALCCLNALVQLILPEYWRLHALKLMAEFHACDTLDMTKYRKKLDQVYCAWLY